MTPLLTIDKSTITYHRGGHAFAVLLWSGLECALAGWWCWIEFSKEGIHLGAEKMLLCFKKQNAHLLTGGGIENLKGGLVLAVKEMARRPLCGVVKEICKSACVLIGRIHLYACRHSYISGHSVLEAEY
jgi:hypothetical protein